MEFCVNDLFLDKKIIQWEINTHLTLPALLIHGLFIAELNLI